MPIPLFLCLGALATAGGPSPSLPPVHVFCGTGDHWWSSEKAPVDSPATIAAMFEWMNSTYGVDCIYWRGGQSELWNDSYNEAPEVPLTYEAEETWSRHLIDGLGINAAAASAAHRRGMKLILYTGLFEHGLQPDMGVVCPYPFEDRLRSEHPEWCPLDRWGERRAPGPLSFAYPEVRKILVGRYLEFLARHRYDGIAFYTYVENVGIHYLDEFGFNAPIAAEFNRRYPAVDLRHDLLTADQKDYWYLCRGQFVTEFLRELHAGMKLQGQALTMILDAQQPDYPQPWWGKPIPGVGNIRMEWQRWIQEGLVDEFWVQLAPVADQQRLLDQLLTATRGTQIKLTARVERPYRELSWKRYEAAGVVLTSCITSPVNGIERVTLAPTSADTIASSDWRLRVQTLADMAAGRVPAAPAAAAARTQDPHPLVRREALQTLQALKAADRVGAIEAALNDPEHSVRLAATKALAVVHGPASARAVLTAAARDPSFVLKLAEIEALGAMGPAAEPLVLAGLDSASASVREVSIRALRPLSGTRVSAEHFTRLAERLEASTAAPIERYWAADSLSKLQARLTPSQRLGFAETLIAAIERDTPPILQLRAADALGSLAPLLNEAEKSRAIAALDGLFGRYGQDCTRSDCAFGWRVAGNALLDFGRPGRDLLESFRTQTRDQWLAWFAYEVVYEPERERKMVLSTPEEAVSHHGRYAPPFPGWRTWSGATVAALPSISQRVK